MSKNANLVLSIAMGRAGAARRRRVLFPLWWLFASISTTAVTMCFFQQATVLNSLSMPSAADRVSPVPHFEALDYHPRIGVHHQQRSQGYGRSNSTLNTLPSSAQAYLHTSGPYRWSPENISSRLSLTCTQLARGQVPPQHRRRLCFCGHHVSRPSSPVQSKSRVSLVPESDFKMSSSNDLAASTANSIQGNGAYPPPQAENPEPKAKGPSVITMIVSEQPKPELRTLPNELIHEIFAYVLMLPSRTPLNSYRMDTHLSPNRGRFAKFLVLCKHWVPIVQALFYRQNSFDCRKHGYFYENLFSDPACNIMPPQPVRHHLRRLIIFITPVPASGIKASTHDLRTAIWRTPGWAALRSLTGAEAGFPNLEVLALELRLQSKPAVTDRICNKALFQHVKQAGVTLKARKIIMRAERWKWESVLMFEADTVEWLDVAA